MFSLPIPALEKIIRPILVYFVLLIAFRIFGRRQLAQLNPMDLTVLLMLSNTVQNSIIGDDNSLIGGVIGATSLLTTNWILNYLSYKYTRLAEMIEGTPRVLIEDGVMDKKTVHRENISAQDFHEVLHREGLDQVQRVRLAYLEPSGLITVIPKDDDRIDEINRRLANIERLLHGEAERKQVPAQ